MGTCRELSDRLKKLDKRYTIFTLQEKFKNKFIKKNCGQLGWRNIRTERQEREKSKTEI